MKVVCEGCGARYGISDEKIVGRAVRFRCKKCGATMLVGDPRASAAPAASEPRAARESADRSEASGTGARNESSVLFSLSSLQHLATRAPERRAPAPAAAPASGGSGLIDIRMLAGALEPPSASPPAPIDLGAIAAPLAGPIVIAPAREEHARTRGWLAGGAIVGASMIVAACVLAVAIVSGPPDPASAAPLVRRDDGPSSIATRRDGPAPTATRGDAITTAQHDATATTQRDTAATTQHDATATAQRDAASATTTERGVQSASTEEHDARRATAERRAASGAGDAPAARTADDRTPRSRRRDDRRATTEIPAVPPASHATDEPRSLTTLMDAVIGETPHRRARERTIDDGAAARPATPARADVTSAMRAIGGTVAACGRGEHGIAQVAITFAGETGRASSAVVTGAFAGTPIGSCVAQAARRATLPPFQRPSFVVTFPFRL